MSTLETNDGVELYYKDWGEGRPVVFSHGWPLSSDAWEDQMMYLSRRGYRCIAHDRRGHGRSEQPGRGHEMNVYADDLAAVVEALELDDAIVVGHSTGGGEVTRYIARHGTDRVAAAVLVSAIPPLMLQTDDNPEGTPREFFDELRSDLLADRSQAFEEISAPFYGANRSGSEVSQGVRDAFWRMGMQSSLPATHDCVRVFSETDQTDDLRAFDIPTLIVHGDDDQIVPIDAAARKSVELVDDARLEVYDGAPHGLPTTHKERLNRELEAFVGGV